MSNLKNILVAPLIAVSGLSVAYAEKEQSGTTGKSYKHTEDVLEKAGKLTEDVAQITKTYRQVPFIIYRELLTRPQEPVDQTLKESFPPRQQAIKTYVLKGENDFKKLFGPDSQSGINWGKESFLVIYGTNITDYPPSDGLILKFRVNSVGRYQLGKSSGYAKKLEIRYDIIGEKTPSAISNVYGVILKLGMPLLELLERDIIVQLQARQRT
jgi:hypothetical protein